MTSLSEEKKEEIKAFLKKRLQDNPLVKDIY